MKARSATVGDAAACREIYAPFVRDSWISFETDIPSVREMEERIASCLETHGWFVAEKDGSVAGYAYGSQHRTRGAYKTSCDVAVYVRQGYGRRGIGRLLYGVLLAHLRGKGFHAAFGGIALPNDASIALHEAMGFRPVGVYQEVGYKLGDWRDVGWWQRLL